MLKMGAGILFTAAIRGRLVRAWAMKWLRRVGSIVWELGLRVETKFWYCILWRLLHAVVIMVSGDVSGLIAQAVGFSIAGFVFSISCWKRLRNLVVVGVLQVGQLAKGFIAVLVYGIRILVGIGVE